MNMVCISVRTVLLPSAGGARQLELSGFRRRCFRRGAGKVAALKLRTKFATGAALPGRPRQSLAEKIQQRTHALGRSERKPEDLKSNAASAQAALEAADDPSTEALTVRDMLPRMDQLDKTIIKLALPAIMNLMILPLVGAVDTFWVGRMKSALPLAGQSAANQVFNSAYMLASSLPSVLAPMVSKAAAQGDKAIVKERVGEGIYISILMGCLGMICIDLFSDHLLNLVLNSTAPARAFAEPYLDVRAFTLVPALIATVGFAAFRGTMDVVTPLKISAFSNVLNIIADPILIFNYGMGVTGAALATGVAEVSSAGLYIWLLMRRRLLDFSSMLRPPPLNSLKVLLAGAAGLILRSVALNVAFLSIQRTTLAMDASGIAAAAHAITINLWQLGGVFLMAMSTVAAIMVPQALNKPEADGGGKQAAKKVADRLIGWGLVLGIGFGALQILLLPLLNVFSPLPEVRSAAVLPSIIGALLQIINGVVFTAEGIMQGHQEFGLLARSTLVSSALLVMALYLYGSALPGVWGSFWVFNTSRLLFALHHHFISGPLSPSMISMPVKA